MNNNEKSVFATLNAINVNGHTEKKNGLTYLAWAWAWGEVKKQYPDAFYTIYENRDGWNYFTDGRTCWVKTGVTINGLEHIEYLPVMDHRNASIAQERVTSFDVNKAIQRSLTKACARHGLGLYIYAGEDLPEDEKEIPVVRLGEKRKKVDEKVGKLEKELRENKPELMPWESELQPETLDSIFESCDRANISDSVLTGLLKKHYQKENPEDLSEEEAQDFLKKVSEFMGGAK